MNKKHLILAALVVSSLPLACHGSSRDPSLLPGDGGQAAEDERLRKAQAVRVLVADDSSGERVWNASEQEVFSALQYLNQYCYDQTVADPVFSFEDRNRSQCVEQTAKALQYQCVVEHVLEIMALRGSRLEIAPDNRTAWRFLEQPTAAKAALGRQALGYSSLGLDASTRALNAMTGLPFPSFPLPSCATDAELATLDLKSTLAGVAAATFVDEVALHRELVDGTTDAALASADAQWGSTSSFSQAHRRSMFGDELSRAEAAHHLVGGDPGLPAANSDLCTHPERSSQVLAATSVLRESAISPAALSDPDVSIKELLGDGGNTVVGGSVAERLSELWGLTIPSPGRGVAEHFGLRDLDFIEARSYLAEEIVAFGRSTTAQLEPRILAAGVTTTFPRFAATSSEPTTPPVGYYAALARSGNSRELWGFTAGPIVDLDDEDPATVVFDQAHVRAALIVGATDAIPASIRNAVLDPLALLLADRTTLGRVDICLRQVVDTFPHLAVSGFSATDGLRLVVGEDALRCAVEGSVEGSRCELSGIPLTLRDNYSEWVAGRIGYPGAAAADRNLVAELDGVTKRLYLLRPRVGAAGRSPGDFELLVGLPAEACGDYAIAPELDRRVTELLAPSPDWCAMPQVSCADAEFDARLPLEDELSDDGNGIESSWKYYLARARLAAEDAHQLADAYIEAGLAADRRDETASIRDQDRLERAAGDLDRLQAICGTAVDPIYLLELLSGGPGTSGLEALHQNESCTTSSDCSIVFGTRCVAGQCIMDPLGAIESAAKSEDPRLTGDLPELNRLSECLSQGADNVLPAVHLGTKPVCYWHAKGNPNEICAGSDVAHQCPAYIGEGDCAEALGYAPGEVPGDIEIAAIVDTGLGFFYTDDKTSDSSGAKTCEDLATVRSGDSSAFQAIRATGILQRNAVREYAEHIGFEARYGGYSALTNHGAALYKTGSAWAGPETGAWPCDASAVPEHCVPGSDSLFCATIDCESPGQRAEMNDRFLRAVMALKLMTDANPQNILVPSWTNDWVPPGKLTWSPKEGVQGTVLEGTAGTMRGYDAPNYPEGHAARVAYTMPAEPGSNQYFWWDTQDGKTHTKDTVVNGMVIFTDTYQSTFAIDRVREVTASGCTGDDFLGGMSTWNAPMGFVGRVLAGADDEFEAAPGCKPFNMAGALEYVSPSSMLQGGPPCPHNDCELFGPSLQGFPLTNDGRFDFQYLGRSFLDGTELYCKVRLGEHVKSCADAPPPTIVTAEDIPKAQPFLECVANEIETRGGMTLLTRFPARALDPLRKESALGSFPAVGGLYGAALSATRSGLVEIAEVPVLIAEELRQLGEDLRHTYSAIARAGLRPQEMRLKGLATLSNQLASCSASGSSAGPAISAGSGGIGIGASIFGFFGSVATCANSLAQINIANDLSALASESAELEKELAIEGFSARFSSRATTLQTLALRLTTAVDDVDSGLATLEKLRLDANRALLSALWKASFQAERQAEITSVVRRRFNTVQKRYRQAHKNAVTSAFLAKRAIELRLGVRLASIHDDLPLVGAPSSWESTLCASTGVDYAELQDAEGTALGDYADAYIGDYVTMLDNFVESYRMTRAFHEGSDTAVISLRDDVLNVRADCEVEVRNLLMHSDQLDYTVPAGESGGWAGEGCAVEDDEQLPGCVSIHSASDLIGSPVGAPYVVSFGDETGCNPTTCGYRTGAVLAQRVELPAGRYRYSWQTPKAPPVGMGTTTGVVLDATGAVLGTKHTGVLDVGDWERPYIVFDLVVPQEVQVGFNKPESDWSAVVAAPLLERVYEETDSALDDIGVYSATGAASTSTLPVCQDTEGDVFRGTQWHRNCLRLCSDGFSSSCEDGNAATYCYQQIEFSINQRDIEAGTILGKSGFARGNFNYRIESIGLNAVGFGVRDCAGSDTPSTCYSAGFLPFSLHHSGPFYVRNHAGEDFKAELFQGRIEHARALAAERYLSNPMSQTDLGLIQPYIRNELQGRPLDGNFAIRIWEEEGINFDAITDVQVVLNYRYWTRFN